MHGLRHMPQGSKKKRSELATTGSHTAPPHPTPPVQPTRDRTRLRCISVALPPAARYQEPNGPTAFSDAFDQCTYAMVTAVNRQEAPSVSRARLRLAIAISCTHNAQPTPYMFVSKTQRFIPPRANSLFQKDENICAAIERSSASGGTFHGIFEGWSCWAA